MKMTNNKEEKRMKMTKKKVFVVALAVCLIAILSLGTLAWFNASEDVTNKFMVTNSEDEADKIFSVELYETKVDENGEPVVPYEKTEDGNTYDDIAPGDHLTKDPTVENTGLYDQWIRVKVTVTNATNWINALRDSGITDLKDVFEGHNEAKWRSEGNDNPQPDANDEVTFTYYLKEKLAPGNTATLFTAVNIPEDFDQADMATLNEFELKIVAEALQYDNTGTDCFQAFADCWPNP